GLIMDAFTIILTIIAITVVLLYFKKRNGKPVNIGEGITKEEEYGKHFQFEILDDYEEAPSGRWYRFNRWIAPNILKMESTWNKDWKLFSAEEDVRGVTRDNRQDGFLIMGDQEDFKIFLERERDNPVDPNAIKVMGSATVDGEPMIRQLGYLSKETAKMLKDEEDIDARPYSVYLPYQDRSYGLRVRVLIRSQSYERKMKKV
ncbi:hypothetical protein KA005_53390, partial [bacterium]|nr:hypothetical protein [bacterium]